MASSSGLRLRQSDKMAWQALTRKPHSPISLSNFGKDGADVGQQWPLRLPLLCRHHEDLDGQFSLAARRSFLPATNRFSSTDVATCSLPANLLKDNCPLFLAQLIWHNSMPYTTIVMTIMCSILYSHDSAATWRGCCSNSTLTDSEC